MSDVMPGEEGYKTILLDEEGWVVTSCLYEGSACVYAEHIKCPERHDIDAVYAHWSWEIFDGEPAECWACKDPTPDGIVGMVKMLNWNTGDDY